MKKLFSSKSTENVLSRKDITLTISPLESLHGAPIGEGLYKLTDSAYSAPLQTGDIVEGEVVGDLIVCTKLIEPADGVSVVFFAPDDRKQREAIVELVESYEQQGAYAECWERFMVVVT